MNKLIPDDIQPAYPEPLPREAVRGKLLELLGLKEIPTSVDFTIETQRETSDGLLEIPLTYPNSIGETVSGIALVPQDAPPDALGGVVCLPGSMTTAQNVAYPLFYREESGTGRLIGWGRELARRGFATLSLSYKGCPARRGSAAHWDEEERALAVYGRTQIGVAVEEALRGALILAENGWANPQQIGLTGHSLGGQVAWHAMACAPWICAGVPNCGGLGSVDRFIHEANIGQHGSSFYTPHMLRYFDHPEIVFACIAPRPLMMVAPTLDSDMCRSGVEDLIRVVEPVYNSAEHPERFKVYQPEGRHAFLIEYFEWMVQWFRQFLTPHAE